MTDGRLAERLAASGSEERAIVGSAGGISRGDGGDAGAGGGAPTVFVAYLVAHEAYHWGEVGALLAQQGERLPRELAYGLWDWGDAG